MIKWSKSGGGGRGGRGGRTDRGLLPERIHEPRADPYLQEAVLIAENEETTLHISTSHCKRRIAIRRTRLHIYLARFIAMSKTCLSPERRTSVASRSNGYLSGEVTRVLRMCGASRTVLTGGGLWRKSPPNAESAESASRTSTIDAPA